jgi:flagellar hook-associated protein 3 FlgL
VSVANTRFDGRAVFGGFAANAVDATGGSVTLAGDAGEVKRRISDTAVVTVNASAADTFGFSAGDDVFAVLDDLAAATRAGDTATIGGSGLQRLLDRQQDIAQTLGGLGARANNIEQTQNLGTARRDEISAYRSSIVDVDFAEAALELTAAQTAYESVLAATARMQQTSLLDYLR